MREYVNCINCKAFDGDVYALAYLGQHYCKWKGRWVHAGSKLCSKFKQVPNSSVVKY